MPIRRHSAIRRLVGQTHTDKAFSVLVTSGRNMLLLIFALVFDMFITIFPMMRIEFRVEVCEHFNSMAIHSHTHSTRSSWIDGAQLWMDELRTSFSEFYAVPLNWVLRSYTCSMARFSVSKCNNQYVLNADENNKYSVAAHTWSRYTVNARIFAWNRNCALSFASIVCCKRTTITISTNAQNINLQFTNNIVFMPRHICLATRPTIRLVPGTARWDRQGEKREREWETERDR